MTTAHFALHPNGKRCSFFAMMGRSTTAKVASVVGLLAVYCVARLGLVAQLDAPTFGWRPTDLASIALNYYRNGFHFAYPQVLWGGAGAGHVEMEFPLQAFTTALLFKLFGVHDGLCVVLPLAFGFGLVWIVGEFATYLFGEVAGLAAAVNLALSPTLVYITTTGMWPDPPMVFFGTLGLYLLMRWSRGGTQKQLRAGVACVSLAILCKLTALYLGFPVLGLFLLRNGRDFWKMPTTWLAAAAILIPPLFWYAHAYNLYREDGNTFGIIGAGYLKFPTVTLLKDSYLYQHALLRVVWYHLTPLGALACAYGLYRAFAQNERWPLVWFASIVLHTFVVWAGVRYAGHIGYLLPILPICNIFAGLGFQKFWETLRKKPSGYSSPRLVGALLAAVVVLVTVNAVAASRRLNDRDLAFETALWEKKKLTGLEVGKVTRPGSLIIVVDDEMDAVDQKHSMTPPDVFFFGDRRGWYLSLAWLSVDKVDRLRAQGAEYFVVSLQSTPKFTATHPALHDYLEHHFRKVSDQRGLIYALTGG